MELITLDNIRKLGITILVISVCALIVLCFVANNTDHINVYHVGCKHDCESINSDYVRFIPGEPTRCICKNNNTINNIW